MDFNKYVIGEIVFYYLREKVKLYFLINFFYSNCDKKSIIYISCLADIVFF